MIGTIQAQPYYGGMDDNSYGSTDYRDDNKDKKYDDSYGMDDNSYGMDDNSYGSTDYRDDNKDKKYDDSYGMDDNSYGSTDYRDDKNNYEPKYTENNKGYKFSDYPFP
jgi:hypothetical protein